MCLFMSTKSIFTDFDVLCENIYFQYFLRFFYENIRIVLQKTQIVIIVHCLVNVAQ